MVREDLTAHLLLEIVVPRHFLLDSLDLVGCIFVSFRRHLKRTGLHVSDQTLIGVEKRVVASRASLLRVRLELGAFGQCHLHGAGLRLHVAPDDHVAEGVAARVVLPSRIDSSGCGLDDEGILSGKTIAR